MATPAKRAIAAPGDPQVGEPPVRQFVGFRLGNEDYAIAITKTQEIILMKPITRLPPGVRLDRGVDQPARQRDPDH